MGAPERSRHWFASGCWGGFLPHRLFTQSSLTGRWNLNGAFVDDTCLSLHNLVKSLLEPTCTCVYNAFFTSACVCVHLSGLDTMKS